MVLSLAFFLLLSMPLVLADDPPVTGGGGSGGGSSGNTTPAEPENCTEGCVPAGGSCVLTPNITVDMTYFNDSLRTWQNITNRFSPGDTVYYTVYALNETDATLLSGNITLSRENYVDKFHIDSPYNGSFVVENADHSGWWPVDVFFTDGTACAVHSEPYEYAVEPILASFYARATRNVTASYYYKDGFAPGDAVYFDLYPYDQAGKWIDAGLFGNYPFFNKTTIVVYNKTYNESGEFVDTVIFNQTFENTTYYLYNCTDPYDNRTYLCESPNVIKGPVLPGRYATWYADIFVDSAYGSANRTDITLFMPLYAVNVSVTAPSGPLNSGRNITMAFDGWEDLNGDAVVPDGNSLDVEESNVTYGDGWSGWAFVGYNWIASDLTGPFSFTFQKTPGANLAQLYLSARIDGGGYGSSYAEWNTTDALLLSLSAPSSVTEGDSMSVSLNVSWANGDPYEGFGNITVLLIGQSASQNLTLAEVGGGVYSVAVPADQVGTWTLAVDLKDAYNNTGSANKNITVNSKPAPCTSCGGGGGGGGGGGMAAPVNKTTSVKSQPKVEPKPEQSAQPNQPVPAPQPAQPQTEQPKVESPTGMFALGAGIAPAIQSFVAAIVSFFAKLFGGAF